MLVDGWGFGEVGEIPGYLKLLLHICHGDCHGDAKILLKGCNF